MFNIGTRTGTRSIIIGKSKNGLQDCYINSRGNVEQEGGIEDRISISGRVMLGMDGRCSRIG